ncbi:MAG: DUF4386 domain-containing protein [Nocardioides sp.]
MTQNLAQGSRSPAASTPRAEHRTSAQQSARSGGLVAGVALLLMAVVAPIGLLLGVDGLVTDGDAARTATDITASEGTFRLGVASLYLVVVLDVVVAWALLRFFNPVSRELSRLAAWFRLAYSGVFLVAIGQLAGIPGLLDANITTSGFDTEQLQAQALLKADNFHDIWFAGLVLFGAHLVLIGYLAVRSGYVPKLLGALVVVAGVGYALDTFTDVMSQGSPYAVSTVTFLGEPLLALWLVFRARRISIATAQR